MRMVVEGLAARGWGTTCNGAVFCDNPQNFRTGLARGRFFLAWTGGGRTEAAAGIFFESQTEVPHEERLDPLLKGKGWGRP